MLDDLRIGIKVLFLLGWDVDVMFDSVLFKDFFWFEDIDLL